MPVSDDKKKQLERPGIEKHAFFLKTSTVSCTKEKREKDRTGGEEREGRWLA